MTGRGTTTFEPPRAEQVRTYLQRHPATAPSRMLAWMPIIALGGAVMISWAATSGWVQTLPWAIIAGLLVFLTHRVRWVRHMEQQVTRVQELAMTRRYTVAMRLAWRLLPKVAAMPAMHGRVVAFMAHILDQLRAYEAAVFAYEYLIHQLPVEHPGSVQLQIHRAIAQLANDQLADADETLRRVRGHVEALQHPTTGASFRLAHLIQQVRTNHFAEAIESSSHLVADLRPLGIEAGYGHALVALAYHNHALNHGAANDAMAAPWWSQATLLLPVEALVERFAELSTIAGQYPMSPIRPLGPRDTSASGTDRGGASQNSPMLPPP